MWEISITLGSSMVIILIGTVDLTDFNRVGDWNKSYQILGTKELLRVMTIQILHFRIIDRITGQSCELTEIIAVNF